jgi:hypothetical protein
MSAHYHAIRQLQKNETYKKGDVLVLFGELFTRGYANGLVEEAERRGMTIIRSTVGRRDQGLLRPLNAEETASIPQPFINIPLEAGFDLEPSSKGVSPVDLLKNVKLSDWESFRMDRESIFESQKKGQYRFHAQVKEYLAELEKHIPRGANVLFAHLMAGGVPRTKIVMPLMNRAFKGIGDRWLSSETFWNSDIGQICSMSFDEVTANTFDILIQESTFLREKWKAQGARNIGYVAYGYHGTEVLIENEYAWQTYSPYIQGWAKMRLEQFSQDWSKKGVTCAIYNSPEILTNSSSIFQGVEVSLYPLVGALKKDGGNSHRALDTLAKCRGILKPEFTLEDVMAFTGEYLKSPLIRDHCHFEQWPQHSSQKQMEVMLQSSDHLISMHKDEKVLLTHILSEVVFAGCGKVMLNDIANPESPVSWINHDLLAKVHAERA